LRDGAVVAVDSPGSPGADVLLVSSGMIGQSDWTAALVDSVELRSLEAALVSRGLGATEVQGIAAAAVRDGTFAVAAGDIERCFVDESVDEPLLPASTGVDPDVLLTETALRLDVLASVSPYRDRVVAAAERSGSTEEEREIIALATGRRNARDMAFALGRGLHPVTVAIAGMLGDGLLEIAPPDTSFSFSHWGLAALRPRTGAEFLPHPRPREVEC
jgi:stage V sporulation protein SpoVS